MEEIINIPVPYLDAVVEEILRLSIVAAGVVRKALADTEILGFRIPKDTTVFCLPNGPGVLSPAFEIEEGRRHPAARKGKSGLRVGEWEREGMRDFLPERWLEPEEEDHDDKRVDVEDVDRGWKFNANAGPMMSFGLGPRQCYGQRLAYLELRIIVVVLVWRFVLHPCPEQLSSYKADERFTRHPEQCYVKLEPIYFN